ncbi:MAG: nucleotidyl transferase AbiEii/AbiGii toxin family protein, partial [Synergistota bacterium]|nr:nucleotidyl transferase AbiEii/AbiGii toxin family protein [Synergistota bacterium]
MFWDVLDEHRQSLLREICAAPPFPDAYLAGGTALALIYGHRQSEDFDWFLPGSFD